LISPDEIAFFGHGPLESTRFGHTERTITVNKGRLRPPWSNTFLVLQDKAGQVRASRYPGSCATASEKRCGIPASECKNTAR
jgi:hypothetical protein